MLSLVALALSLTSPTELNEPKSADSYQEICREAVDWKGMGKTDASDEHSLQREGEAYVGRMEIALSKRNFQGQDRDNAKIFCEMYLAGSSDQIKWINDQLGKENSKVALGPAGR